MGPQNYAIAATKGVTQSFDNGVNMTIEKWMELPLVDIEYNKIATSIYTSTEGLTGTKELADFETPPSSSLEEGYSVSLTNSRYGNGIEMPERTYRIDGLDMTTNVDKFLITQRNLLLKDVKYKLVTDIHLFLNDGFAGTFLLAPDAQPAFDTAHTWNTNGAATFDNTSTLALDTGAIAAMEAYAGAFVGPDGKQKPINFDHIFVKKGSAAAAEARRLFAHMIQPTAVNDVNIYYGTYTIVETPYITNPLHWFAFASDEGTPFKIEIAEAPTLREPLVEKNQAIWTAVTGFWKKGIVNMPFAVYGSTGVA